MYNTHHPTKASLEPTTALQEQVKHGTVHLPVQEELTGFVDGYPSAVVDVLEENVKETSKDMFIQVRHRLGLREQFLTCQYAGVDETVPHVTLFFASAM